MKTATLGCVAALAVARAAYGQGTISVYNGAAINGVADLTVGNYYTGTYGLQVWALSPEPTGSALTTLLSGIDGLTGLQAYNAMVADGFTRLTEYDSQPMSDGFIHLGELTSYAMPPGTVVVLGVVAWNTGTTYAALPSSAHLGVLAFPQYSVNLNEALPPLVPDLSAGWNSVGEDLVMVPIPEPGALSLAALGLVALLIFERRR